MTTEQEILLLQVFPYLRQLGYNVIRLEQWFGVGSRRVKADAVAYDDRDVPAVLVEMKRDLSGIGEEPSPYDPLVQETFRSALVAASPYFLLSDGSRFLWFRVDLSIGVPELVKMPPQVSLGPTGLVPFHNAEEVQQVVTAVTNLIGSQTPLPRSGAGEEVLKLLQAKVCDERRIQAGHERQFYAETGEDTKQVVGRIQRLYQQWTPQDRLPDQIPVSIWGAAISLLQPFSLLHTDTRFLKPVIDGIFASSARRETGCYITPQNLVSFMVQLIAPQPGERVLDPVCGTGGFLVAILAEWGLSGNSVNEAANVYGVDRDPLAIKLARLNAVIAGGQLESIFVANSLNQAALDKLGLHRASFDVILADPPMGTLDIAEPALSQEYELARRRKGSRQRIEILFLEQCLWLLKPGGRMAIVLPDGLLSNSAYQFVREWLIQKAHIDAVVSLPVHTFLPYVGVKTSVLAITKEPLETKEQMLMAATGIRQQVFMAVAEEVGYDHQGRLSDTNDLPGILEEYHRYRQARSAFAKDKAWVVVGEPDQLVTQLGVMSYKPEYHQTLEKLGRLNVPIVRLGEIAETVARGTVIAKPVFSETGVPVIGPRQVNEGRLHLIGAPYVPQSFVETQPQQFALKPGDLLVSLRGQVGKSALVTSDDLPAIAGQGVIVVRLKSDILSPDFLGLLFATKWIQHQIDMYVRKTGVPSLHIEDFRRLLIPVPDLSIQNKVAAQLRRAATLREEAHVLEQEAQALLAAFLEGTDSYAK